MHLHATLTSPVTGETTDICGESVEELAAELPEDYDGPAIRVTDAPGFTRGWIRARDDWQAS